MRVAEGLNPSPTRENADSNIWDSTNMGSCRPYKCHKIKKGGNFRGATRRDWNVGDLGEVSVPLPVQW